MYVWVCLFFKNKSKLTQWGIQIWKHHDIHFHVYITYTLSQITGWDHEFLFFDALQFKYHLPKAASGDICGYSDV